MNTPSLHDKQDPALHQLAAGETVSIIGRSGLVVRVLQGRIWITQEGDARDYVVPAGMRFCVARSGHVVISAVTNDTTIALYRVHSSPAAEWTRNQVCFEPDFELTARREAQREMARQMVALVSRLWRRVRRLWTGRSGTTPPSRLRSYHRG